MWSRGHIYLSKKYSNVDFTGITIAPNQVELAKKFAEKREVNNTSFMLGTYLDTKFPNNYFDGVFALESSSYAQNHNEFVDEMFSILKPGGRLVVVDSFRIKDPLNPIMQKIYNEFCLGFGYANLPVLDSYTTYLKEKGFSKINVEDISKNVGKSVFVYSVAVFPFFLSNISKRVLKFGKYRLADDLVGFYRGSTILAGLLGLSGAIGYFGTSTVKR